MKPLTLKEFCDELSKAYAIDYDGHMWYKRNICANWLDKHKWLSAGDLTGEIVSLSVFNGSENRLFTKDEDPIFYDESADEYTLIHNQEIYEDTGEKDDEDFTIYKNTHVWKKESVKLILLYRKIK